MIDLSVTGRKAGRRRLRYVGGYEAGYEAATSFELHTPPEHEPEPAPPEYEPEPGPDPIGDPPMPAPYQPEPVELPPATPPEHQPQMHAILRGAKRFAARSILSAA